MSPRTVIGIAAFIWIFIKLPQEWWIHVAQLDFTDEVAAHSWLMPLVIVAVLAVVVVLWWAITYRLPPRDHGIEVLAPPLPAEVEAGASGPYGMAHWRLFDWNLVEKVVFLSLVCVDFAQIIPRVTARPSEVIAWVTVLVVANAALGLAFVRRRGSIRNFALQLLAQLALNLAIVWVARLFTDRFNTNDVMFFVLLITLIVTLYDRYRPVRELHRHAPDLATGRDDPAPDPSPTLQ
jgi:hypothetical protein